LHVRIPRPTVIVRGRVPTRVIVKMGHDFSSLYE
jgi:hypothetical protein